MKIAKLAITPILKGLPSVVIDSPDAERAGRLINDRLNSGFKDYNRLPRAYRKIPKFLKGFVNPATKTGERKFSVDI